MSSNANDVSEGVREKIARAIYGPDSATCTHWGELDPATKSRMFTKADAVLATLSPPASPQGVEGLLDAYDDARRKLDYSNPKWASHQSTYDAMVAARKAVLAALAEKRS